MITITLPWPCRDVHPNARPHWAARARATKKMKAWAHNATLAAGVKLPPDSSPVVDITFHPPNKARRDLDGCISSCKAYLDGISDTIGVDDHRFSIAARMGEVDKPSGRVVVRLWQEG